MPAADGPSPNQPSGPPSGPGAPTGGESFAPTGPPPAGGPPPFGGPPPPTGPPPGDGSGTGRPSTPLLLAIAAVVVVGLVVVLILATGSGDETAQDTPVLGPSEVLLEPNDTLGPEPFDDATSVTEVGPDSMPPTSAVESTTTEATITTEAPTTTAAPTTTIAPSGVATLVGSNPGLYGGTRDNQTCDREQMKAFLAANPTKAQAWVSALNTDPTVQWSGPTPLTTADIGPYIDELTPVLLSGDTRVTNHGFGNGSFTSRQVVLQAGTAVLVDRWGVPRARCLCGNPLTKAIPVQGASGTTYVGPRWPSFAPTTIVVIVPAEPADRHARDHRRPDRHGHRAPGRDSRRRRHHAGADHADHDNTAADHPAAGTDHDRRDGGAEPPTATTVAPSPTAAPSTVLPGCDVL